jgi:hypothetical protein
MSGLKSVDTATPTSVVHFADSPPRHPQAAIPSSGLAAADRNNMCRTRR